MDISAVVLNKLLNTKDLESFSRIKLSFIDPAYSSVFSAISRYYNKYSALPNFEDLELTLREGATKNTLEAIKLTDTADVSLDVAIDALIDNYTQNESLRLIERLVDKVTTLDTESIKAEIANISIVLDEKTVTSDSVFNMNDFMLFQQEEEVSRNRFFLGINNDFDVAIGGFARQEYMLIGGKRGQGKSIIGHNIMINQYRSGNICPMFTIEMRAREVIERSMATLADVSYSDLKQGKLDANSLLKVVEQRAAMFEDAKDLVEEYKVHRDRFKFETDLTRTKNLRQDGQIIIIDDRELTLSKIDIWLGKLKAVHGDRLTCAVIDYINQINIGTQNSSYHEGKYDWKAQVEVSTQLKNLARKYDIGIISPYQIDESGEARFAKGILDSADISIIIMPTAKEDNILSMQTTKIRGAAEQVFHSGMDWKSLSISPVSVTPPAKKEKSKKSKSEDKEDKPKDASSEGSDDIPW